MAKLKDLYIATSMEDLNRKCEFVFEKGKSMKSYLAMVNKTYLAAETAYKNNDEERAYILYMRYGDAMMKVRKTKEFQQQSDHYNNLFGSTKLTAALDRAEKLSQALKNRYMKLAESSTVKKTKENEPDKVDATKKKAPSAEQSFPKDKITSQQLHQLLYKQQKQVLVMDIRSIKEYEESHCIHPLCINVPKEAIAPGSVTSKIEKGIPLDCIKVWNTRDSADLVVLMDWHSAVERLKDKADPLRSLKDSIYKWEQNKELAREPVILEGGYVDWLESYPQFTSNPHVNPPDNKPKTSNINSLLDFTYADLRKSFASQPKEEIIDESSDLPNGITHFATNGEVAANATVNGKTSSAMPTVQTGGKVAPGKEKDVPALYPEIDSNIKTSKNFSKASELPIPATTLPQFVPSFDRSVKPKPVATPSINKVPKATSPKKSKSPDSSPLPPRREDAAARPAGSEKSPAKIAPKTIDRSTKPKPPVEQKQKKPDNDPEAQTVKQTEISDLENRLLKMKQDQDEKEKRVVEMEEKKRLHQLLSEEAEMKRKAQELAQREVKAQSELAAAMRQDKPTFAHAAADARDSVEAKVVPPAQPVSNNSSISSSPRTTKENSSSASKASGKDQPPVKKEPAVTKDKTSPVKKAPPAASPASTPQTSSQPPTTPKPAPQPHNDSSSGASGNSKAAGPPNISPPTYASVKMNPGTSSDTNIPAPSTSNSFSVRQPVSNPTVYREPLKDESETSSFGLKRSFSSPNIAKMVQQDLDTPSVPSRQKKPNLSSQMIPSRESKPDFQEELDPMVTRLNLSLRGVVGGGGEGAKCGLRNLGNSCYMNSVLQCMFNITQLADYFLTFSYRQDVKRKNVAGRGGKVAEIFAVLLRAIWGGQYRYLIPTDMKQVAGEIKEEFAGYTQEDSHEFLLVLLDALHEDLNKIVNFKYEVMPDNDNLSDQDAAVMAWNFHKRRNESIIIELFSGQYKATMKCLHCGTTSRKFDTFQFLTLSLPTRSCSLDELIRDFSKEEKLTGDNRWKCPKCKALRNAVRTIEIWKLPPVLIIHLKRFVYSGVWRDKIHTNVSFPTQGLNLTKFTVGPTKRPCYDLFAVSVRKFICTERSFPMHLF